LFGVGLDAPKGLLAIVGFLLFLVLFLVEGGGGIGDGLLGKDGGGIGQFVDDVDFVALKIDVPDSAVEEFGEYGYADGG
jgi:hypothetical protein